MDYSEMKATKVDKKEGIKDALSKLSGDSQKGNSTKKKSSSTRSSGTNKSSSTRKTSSTNRSSSTRKRTSGTRRRSTKKPDTVIGSVIEAVTEVAGSSGKEIKGSSIKKARKKVALLLGIIFLLVGLASGFLTMHFVCANDVYEMVCYENGQADIVICADEEAGTPKYYTELGVKCIAFGKDCSKLGENCIAFSENNTQDYTVTYYYRNDLTEQEIQVDRVDERVSGMYYAVYTAPSKKYGLVKLIRNITVIGGEEDVL